MENKNFFDIQYAVTNQASTNIVMEDVGIENGKELLKSFEQVTAYNESKCVGLIPQSPVNFVMEGELDFEDEVEAKVEDDLLLKENINEDLQKDLSVSKDFKLKGVSTADEENQTSGKEDGQLSPEKDEIKVESVEEGEDDGELSDDDDLEEGEVKDTTPVAKQQIKQVCRFFNRGQCTWGNLCRFLHLSVNDRGNYNMFAPSNKSAVSYGVPGNGMTMGPLPILGHLHQRPSPRNGPEFQPSSVPPPLPLSSEIIPPVESAWERGLRHAKEMVKKASRRKEQEPDFEDKRLNLSIDENERLASSEYDKENDYYGKLTYRKQNDIVPFSRYEETADAYNTNEREGKEHWHGGRFENFEIRWTRSEGQKDRKEKDRSRNAKLSAEREKIPRQLRGSKWRDERLSEIQTARSRADEWRDPWRRSKTPKGRRSRSKVRSQDSYSSVSSHSYSERSSHSSYSYSRSSSRSSFYSSRSQSLNKTLLKRKLSPMKEHLPLNKVANNHLSAFKRKSHSSRNTRSRSFSRSHSSHSLSHSRSSSSRSRSATRTHSISRSRTRSRSYSRSLSMDSVSSASSSISRSSSHSGTGRSHSAHILFPKRDDGKPVIPKPESNTTRSLFEEMQRLQQYGKIQERHKATPPKTISSSLDIASHLKNAALSEKDKIVVKPEPGLKSQDMILVVEKPMKDIPKPTVLKQQIKLTLLNKGLSPRIPNPLKREQDVGKGKLPEKDDSTKAAIKQPLSPGSGKVAVKDKKSTSSRRDELLKQLKAVEDAIARKRAKFS